MRRSLFAVVAAAVLMLSACGSSSTTATHPVASASPSIKMSRVAPANGPIITGSAYTFRAPQGWGPPSQPIPGFDPDSAAFQRHATAGFTSNVNVLNDTSANASTTIDEYQAGGLSNLERVGAVDVQLRDRVLIDGRQAIHISSQMSSGTKKYAVESYAAEDSGRWWDITFGFSTSISSGVRDNAIQSMLETWKWDDSTSTSS